MPGSRDCDAALSRHLEFLPKSRVLPPLCRPLCLGFWGVAFDFANLGEQVVLRVALMRGSLDVHDGKDASLEQGEDAGDAAKPRVRDEDSALRGKQREDTTQSVPGGGAGACARSPC